MGNVAEVVPTGITTHVLDSSRGRPAAGVFVRLEQWDADGWQLLGQSQTDPQGRCRDLLPPRILLRPGIYRLVFDTAAFFGAGAPAFFPEVAISFNVADSHQHYHVPLLLSPFGYTTYRGS